MGKLVKSIDDMDDDTLIKHYNSRHMPIAKLDEVRFKTTDPGQKLLRRYHERIHFVGYDDVLPNRRDLNHEHAK